MRFLSADQIFDGREFLPATALLALHDDGRLDAVLDKADVDPGRVEHREGLLTPGFVNSHCHLELSHLKGRIARHTGLPGFARQIIITRDSCPPEEQAEHMRAADKAMWQNGVVAVGDISNGPGSFGIKAGSPLLYHTFIELIGLDPSRAGLVFEKGLELLQQLKAYDLRGSLAPHAPYSTSRALIGRIAGHDQAQGLPLSIHNQESEEETKFFGGQPSGFHELYSFLGLDLSWFKAPGVSSLAWYAGELPAATPSLLVHNTCTAVADLERVVRAQAFWCFCPGANLYIESRLPDFSLFRHYGDRISMGTDSLASNDQLDLLAEANHILEATPVFTVQTLLRALTYNGAEALGISNRFGQLLPGKNAGLNLLSYRNNRFSFLKKIT